MASIVNDVVSSIWTPGTNPGLITAMNASFYGLFATLFALILATNFNLHVVALLGVSIALFASIKWFLAQIAEIEKEQKTKAGEQQAQPETDTPAAKKDQ